MSQSTLSAAMESEKAKAKAKAVKEQAHKHSAKSSEVRGNLAKLHAPDEMVAAFEMVATQQERELAAKAKTKREREAALRRDEMREEELADDEEEEEEEEEELGMETLGYRERAQQVTPVDLASTAPLTSEAKLVLANLIKVSHKPKKATTTSNNAAEIASLKGKLASLKEDALLTKPGKVKKQAAPPKKLVAGATEVYVPHGQVLIPVSHPARKARKVVAKKPVAKKLSALEMAFANVDSSPEFSEVNPGLHSEADMALQEERQYTLQAEKGIASERHRKVQKRRNQRRELEQLRMKMLAPPPAVEAAKPKPSPAVEAAKPKPSHRDTMSAAVVRTRGKLNKDLGSVSGRGKAFESSIVKHYNKEEDATAEQIAAKLMKTLSGHAMDDASLEAKVTKMLGGGAKEPKVAPKKEEPMVAKAAKKAAPVLAMSAPKKEKVPKAAKKAVPAHQAMATPKKPVQIHNIHKTILQHASPIVGDATDARAWHTKPVAEVRQVEVALVKKTWFSKAMVEDLKEADQALSQTAADASPQIEDPEPAHIATEETTLDIPRSPLATFRIQTAAMRVEP